MQITNLNSELGFFLFVTLFFVAFIAATIWPMASEAYFSFTITEQTNHVVWLWLVASVGNGLGSITMFELAGFSSAWVDKKMVSYAHRWQKAHLLMKAHGTPLLFFAWLPIVGDILPLVAGALNLNRGKVYFWLFIGKASRYAALAWGTLAVLRTL
jgi:membrane protein YqaA with SNARE-associated domain